MKTILFFLFCISYLFGYTQKPNPYKQAEVTGANNYSHWLDPIIIEKGKEEYYYNYALTLYKLDSLQKSGQIFDRLFWSEENKAISLKAKIYKGKIESKITEQVAKSLIGRWISTNCITDEANKLSKKKGIVKGDKSIIFKKNDIIFFENNIQQKKIRYTLKVEFNWVFGFSHNCIKFSDSSQEWYYDTMQLDKFISDNLKLMPKPDVPLASYTECFRRVN